MPPEIILYIVIFLYGIVIGSFLNVCIYRIPLAESIVKTSSHCMACGTKLKWYHLIPLFSYLGLRGRCQYCKQKISIQYPMIETLNGIVYVLIFWVNGWKASSFLYCLLTSALIVLSVIDFRTFEIPFGINVFIFTLGILNLILDSTNWLGYFMGFLAISVFLFIILLITKGRGIGGGDVKLMAACGLLIGWKKIILAFFLGCILASVIHIVRMKISHVDHVLAFGPYLATGIFIAILWGEEIINWYITLY